MSSHELLLLRHAQALTQERGQRDIERALAPEGIEQSRAAGSWLAERGLIPDRVLVSPSLRTRQTLAAVEEQINLPPAHPEASIYEATPGDLCALLSRHEDARRLLLVGHNPGLEHLVALLTEGRSGEARGMPVAGLAWLAVEDERPLEPGCARLLGFWSP